MRRAMRTATAGMGTWIAAVLATAGPALAAVRASQGGTAWVDVPLAELDLERVEQPELDVDEAFRSWHHGVPARVVLEGPGEAYVAGSDAEPDARIRRGRLTAEVPAAGTLAGRLVLPRWGAGDLGCEVWTFRAEARPGDAAAHQAFLRAKAEHHEALARTGHPGAAWFRHVAREARAALGDDAQASVDDPRRPGRGDDFQRSFELFSGGRAIAENLQLDRALFDAGDDGAATVDVAEIPGIEVSEIDWAPLLEGVEVDPDPLAARVPADQHAIFFPSFGAFADVVDEAAGFGAPVLALLEPRAEDAGTRERTERQLCVELDGLARLLGPAAVRAVALTGSDPFLRTGSDVALWLDCASPELVLTHVRERQQRAAADRADAERGERAFGDLAATFVATPDRALSSWVARAGDAVIVSNSPVQLERAAAVLAGAQAALDEAPEYRFFRHRYPRGEEESAFVVLTDATIRRWCGPRWRIGASRRTRAAAVLAELQARHAGDLVAGVEARALALEAPLELPGAVVLEPGGVRSELYGTLAFATPVAELDVGRASEREREAYMRFRNAYQRDWSTYFDPIAARLTVASGRLALDLTVMPLIEGSDYRELISVTRGVALEPGDGDPHPEALLHLALALNREARQVREVSGMAGAMAGIAEPLGWMGESLSLYLDRDPLWDEWAAAEEPEAFLDENVWRLPLALDVEVQSPVRLAAFLTTLRAFVEQTTPGMTTWENRTHGERPFVTVRASEEFAGGEQLALHYVALPDRLVVSLSEAMIQRAIERHAARAAGEAGEPVTWPGENVALRVDLGARRLLEQLGALGLRSSLRSASWANLPILNALREAFPGRDALALHESLWGTRLRCPGGGEYVWDAAWSTYSSTAYGHPAAPLEGPRLPPAADGLRAAAFGLTFEDDGLRARAELERDPR